jgi:ribosomal protein S18 acetylase RimI-like enzyme
MPPSDGCYVAGSVQYHSEAQIRVQGVFARVLCSTTDVKLGEAGVMAEILITNTRLDFTPQLVELQIICYPTLADSSRLKAPHFESHLRIFPAGQWVALEGERVVAMSAGFLYTFDFDHPHHTFDEIIDYGFFTRHDPEGQHFYGADISVHPEYRGRGIARCLYDARKELVRRQGLRGIVTGAMIPGFAQYKSVMAAETYVARVVAGEIFDPTLSVQLRQGFHVRGLLANYLPDSATDGWSVLIEWGPSQP